MSPGGGGKKGSGDGQDSLLRKYQDLLHKHGALVEKQLGRATEQLPALRLSWWALQTTASALALISEERVLASNPRWAELQQGGASLWCSPGPRASGAPRSLRQLAVAEAKALIGSEQALKVLRVERSGHRQTVELRLERVSPSSPATVLVMARDISHEVRAEEELSRAREELGTRERVLALGQLVSGVAHDLGSTLGAMRMRLQALRADPETVLRHARDLEALDQIVADGSMRVNRLRDFVRQQQQEAPLERMELTRVISDAIELVRSELERGGEHGIRIEADVPELPAVRGNAAELRYVLINLLVNARDAMLDGGCIRVRAGVAEGQVRVRVEDEGAGISPEHLKRIFQPFFTTKGSHGTGLGLSMAFGVMERLGGSITARNRKEGGAVFTLCFPLLSPPKRGRRPARSPGDVPRKKPSRAK